MSGHEHDEKRFLEQVRQTLDREAADLAPETERRLENMRAQALERAGERAWDDLGQQGRMSWIMSGLSSWRVAGPGLALAAALVLALSLGLFRGEGAPERNRTAERDAELMEMVDLLGTVDDPEMLEMLDDMDFYTWLAEQEEAS